MVAIVWLLCGIICFFIAKEKNRNEWLAAVLGILFGIVAVVIYCCLSSKKEEEKNVN